MKEGSNEEVLLADVRHLLSAQKHVDLSKGESLIEKGSPNNQPTFTPPDRFSEVEVEISRLSSTGDGLGFASTSDHVYVVPFSIPGDVVKAKVINYFPNDRYTLADFIKVIKPAADRHESLVKCPYFAKCSGCQLQMLSYEKQLAHKRTIVENAYRNFSSLPPELIPFIGDTIGSPLQYGYRTKLTPHFDGPPGAMSRKARREKRDIKFEEVPPIGFMQKGARRTIDIEDCPIGTDAVRLGMKQERKRVTEEISRYRKGATLLLRESTKRTPNSKGNQTPERSKAQQKSTDVAAERPVAAANGLEQAPNPKIESLMEHQDSKDKASMSLAYVEEKACITDQNAISTEFVDDYIFSNPAGSFFQNNNSILPTFTAYIRDNILDPSSTVPITNLIDAYCGSGLFSVTLSPLFTNTLGIDISSASIRSAHDNALANNITNAKFISADATALFASVTFPPDETVVVIDPPRKGCDESFLRQLLNYGPRRVVYVSCNVHTQARDVGVLVEGRRKEEGEGEQKKIRYEIESLRGFDFFPQTAHVEGVAILRRVEKGVDEHV